MLKLFKIQKIWHLLSKKPTIWAVFSQKLGEILKNPNKTQRINEKTQGFYEKTQGNLAKTQLSANSELVRNAEFCPKKSLATPIILSFEKSKNTFAPCIGPSFYQV